MPLRKGGSKDATGSVTSKGSSAGKKESKGGSAIKVRHILCEKQVGFSLLRIIDFAIFSKKP